MRDDLNFVDDLLPTRAECEEEAFRDRVTAECRKDRYYRRLVEVIDRLQEHIVPHPILLSKLETTRREMFDETADNLADLDELQRDPHRYYGVSPRDFM